jgi:hypothetical protein
MEQFIGTDKTRGARAHLNLDEEDEHVDMVWNMIMRVIQTPEDEEAFVRHLIKINALFTSYFFEVFYSAQQAGGSGEPQPTPAAPLTAIKIAAGTTA